MSLLRAIWGLFFRLFPCPTRTGLRQIGRPGRDSPVLVTCNFYTTVRRVERVLRRARVDAWLLVANSKGINVWCAAGGEELDTRQVVAALKTSGVADQVDHRRVILPPLSAPAVCAYALRAQCDWTPRWGPVRANDLPAYLSARQHRTPAMKRVTWTWFERLDPALGSYFALLPLGVAGFALIAPSLLLSFLLVSVASFVLFFLVAPWLPGHAGITKTALVEALLGAALVLSELWSARGLPPLRAELIMAMVLIFIYGFELGGLAPNLKSGFDPFLARLGVDRIGNTRFAGTVRTDLLNGRRTLTLDRERCIGCQSCHEVCPQGVWEMGNDNRAQLVHTERCTACRACLIQCEPGAIEAQRIAEDSGGSS